QKWSGFMGPLQVKNIITTKAFKISYLCLSDFHTFHQSPARITAHRPSSAQPGRVKSRAHRS
ncbi:MAG: hypothetical protein ACTSQ8_23340, partial [Candidatus Helarchaeota archaeon]